MSSRQLFGTRLDFITFTRKESGANLFLLLPFRQAVHAPFFSFMLAIINRKMSKQHLEYALKLRKKCVCQIFILTFFGTMAIKTIDEQICNLCRILLFPNGLSLFVRKIV